MVRQIFTFPFAAIAVIVLSLQVSPSRAGPLSTGGLTGELERVVEPDTILVEEGYRTRSRDVGKRPQQRSRRIERSRSERRVQRSERRARKAERRARRAERSRSERRAVRSDRRARKAERRARKAERRHDRRRHVNKRHRHKHKRHRRHRHSGFYGYGGFFPYSPFGRYDYYDGYGYDDRYYEPARRTKISCKRARKHLSRSGYRRMKAYDCRGKVYGFYAWRGKYRYKVRISAYTSRILVANRI